MTTANEEQADVGAAPIVRLFRFRIEPGAQTRARLTNWEHALRFIWNLANEQRRLGFMRPRGEKVFPSAYDQAREVTPLRAEHAWLADLPRQSVTEILGRLHDSWRAFFSGKRRMPRFKKKHDTQPSIGLDARDVFWLSDATVRLPKIGAIRIIKHRRLPGQTVGVTLARDVDQWFAVFTQKIPHALPPRRSGTVGIDRGVAALTADSDGKLIENPYFIARSASKLKRASQNLARTKKGSANRTKARLRVAKVHRKIRRQRAWLQHQISHDYANSHGTVVIEKLETSSMTRSARGTVEAPGRNVRAKAGLNRSILDAGWYGLKEKLRYKLEERGGELVEVPAAYSSQTCSACGVVDAASRRTQAEFCCVACGHEQNADVNAARVILSRWSPPVQPVEAS